MRPPATAPQLFPSFLFIIYYNLNDIHQAYKYLYMTSLVGQLNISTPFLIRRTCFTFCGDHHTYSVISRLWFFPQKILFSTSGLFSSTSASKKVQGWFFTYVSQHFPILVTLQSVSSLTSRIAHSSKVSPWAIFPLQSPYLPVLLSCTNKNLSLLLLVMMAPETGIQVKACLMSSITQGSTLKQSGRYSLTLSMKYSSSAV